MKPFKFFRTPFNPRQYDVEGFTFIGVSPIKTHEDVPGRYRTMIFMDNNTRLPLTANLINEHEEAFHQADIIDVRGDQIFQLPRREAEYINVTLTFTPNETI
jgi:negative regulator of sigma E activity